MPHADRGPAMKPELAALAQEIRKLVSAGEISRARETMAQVLNRLLNRDPMIGRMNVKLAPIKDIGVLTHHESLITISGENRNLYIPNEILDRNFDGLIPRYEAIHQLCMTAPVLGVTEGQAIWDLGDASTEGEYPRVCYSSNLPNARLIADMYFMLIYRGYSDLRAAIRSRWIAWRERKDAILWRGGTTGKRAYKPELEEPFRDWGWLQRLRLCDVAAQSPHRESLDIGVVEAGQGGFVQIWEDFLVRAINDSGFVRPRCGKLDYLKYRYIVDIDGNGNAWDGLFTAMLMGATVFKVTSPSGFRQWYYDKLVPWENYIPVKADLSDFDEQVEWAFGHPEECAAMGAAIKALADRMTYETELEYSAHVLRRALAGPPPEAIGGAGRVDR